MGGNRISSGIRRRAFEDLSPSGTFQRAKDKCDRRSQMLVTILTVQPKQSGSYQISSRRSKVRSPQSAKES